VADVVDAATRSRMMSGIQGKNTKPEVSIRKALHARGFRYRIHVNNLPGKPDLVLPKYNTVVFVHGCFWHGHTCRYFKVPQTRPDFWLEKIGKNQARDRLQESVLLDQGWRVLIVWECAVRLMKKEKSTVLIDLVADWLINGNEHLQIDETICSPTALVTTSKA
jgi:DNA mismatch endonuclease (patch repair protein)